MISKKFYLSWFKRVQHIRLGCLLTWFHSRTQCHDPCFVESAEPLKNLAKEIQAALGLVVGLIALRVGFSMKDLRLQ